MKRKGASAGVVIVLTLVICSVAVWQFRSLTSSLSAGKSRWENSRSLELLPSSYDYRRVGRAPGIKDQGELGTCWAFASLTALESTLMPKEKLDLSEDHMSLQNGFNMTQDEGGDYAMSMAYLLSWKGPVLESEDPYGDGHSPSGLKPVKHVQGIELLPSKDYEAIKEAVYRVGGVQSSLYTSITDHNSHSIYYNEDTYAYCYQGDKEPNHDAVIIGWDDHYPKENFSVEPEGDGAFLCASSWGTGFGDGGCFYVSYYDSNIGKHNILYTDVEDVKQYDHIYQTDLRGWVGQLGYGKDLAYGANVYQAGGKETLKAAGFYATGPDTEYEVYVDRHVDGKPDLEGSILAARGKVHNSGFYTVKLDEPVKLEEKERFAVIVKLRTPGSVHPFAIEYQADDSLGPVDLKDGDGYISLDGAVWESAEEVYQCNLCLKAYTSDQDGKP